MSSTIYGIQNIIVQPRDGHSIIIHNRDKEISNPNLAHEDTSKYHMRISINKKIIKAIVDITCGNNSVVKHSSTVCRISVGSSSRTIGAGVLVLGTRTRSTRVLNFWYSYCTPTRENQSDSTRTCTRGKVLRYSYEYLHEY